MKRPLCDLHLHTTASDGIFSPAALIDHAAANDVGAVAVTDHDTVDGLDEASARAAAAGVEFVPGIEFSVEHPEGSFHLLGYYIDHRNESLLKLIGYLKERRGTRIHRIIDDLARHGIDLPLEEVLAVSEGGSPGRPHVARVLIKHGYASDMKDAFANFLVRGKPGFVKKDKATLEEAMGHIIDAGGIPVLAHPISLECRDMKEFEQVLDGLVEMGLGGIEACASMHREEEVREFERIAEARHLLVTGGSDFHGDKNEKIGWYGENNPIPWRLFEELDSYKKKNMPAG